MLQSLFQTKYPDRRALLAAIPIRNPQVRIAGGKNSAVMLKAPLKKTLLKRMLGLPNHEKYFELDDLGASVWRACNGSSTIEQIITNFAAQHRLNIREAEVSITTFINTLMRRGLLVLAVGKS